MEPFHSQSDGTAIIARRVVCTSEDYSLKQSGAAVVGRWGKSSRLDQEMNMKPLPRARRLTIEKVLSEQRFTLPPSRYTEAGLVKALEEKG